MSDYDKAVEAAAEEFEKNVWMADPEMVGSNPAKLFCYGIEWCRKNPPPETLALVEAVKDYQHECCEPGVDPSRKFRLSEWMFEALANFERTLK